jgi:DNA-binding LacI/PurR family transcriptional regulator
MYATVMNHADVAKRAQVPAATVSRALEAGREISIEPVLIVRESTGLCRAE